MDATAQRFVLWALKSLGMEIEPCGNGAFSCGLRNGERDAFGGSEQICFSFEPTTAESGLTVEYLTFGAPLFRWLMKQLTAAGKPMHAAPAGQPQSVHELSQRLFDTYVLDEGNVHLSGCTLEDRPFLRLTFLEQEELASRREVLTHVFMDAKGNVLSDGLRTSLGLDDLVPLAPPPHQLNHSDLKRWIAAGNRLYQSSGRSAAHSELVAVAIVWCKHVEGKLSFVTHDAGADVSFSGWAQLLKDGRTKPPPFPCPHSGEASYHLSVTDDGRLTVAEAIGVCAETGQRVLKIELETCEATGNLALEERFVTCPVSEQRVLCSALETCSECRREVSPGVLEAARCTACRNVQSISKDDPRMARLLGEYPQLDRWRRWHMSETADVYILNATGLAKRLLLVVDKDSLEVLRLARRGRFATNWIDLASNDRTDLLR
ncbi:MAG: hypothetical protein ACC628_09810 [Pirellulaceae bacterium]